jgi:FMN-dependent NADH-azoreductase
VADDFIEEYKAEESSTEVEKENVEIEPVQKKSKEVC